MNITSASSRGLNSASLRILSNGRTLLVSLISCLILLSVPANADTLLGIVSDRSAPVLAAGAESYLEKNSNHQLILRSTTQLAELSDIEISRLIERADIVCIAGVFGDQVSRIQNLLEQRESIIPTIALNSDLRLVRSSILNNQVIFRNVSQTIYDQLIADTTSTEERQAVLAELGNSSTTMRHWLRMRDYWKSRSSDNAERLLAYAMHLTSGSPAPAPAIESLDVRVDYGSSQKSSRPFVALIDLQSSDTLDGRHLHQMIRKKLKGEDLDVVSYFSKWGKSSYEAVEQIQALAETKPLSSIVVLQDFVVGGGSHRTKVTELFSKLGAPVFKGVRLTDRSVDQWRISLDGIPWKGVHYRIAMPELQGQSQPLVLAAASTPSIQASTGLRTQPIQPIDDQIQLLSERIVRWNALAKKDNADKKVAIVYYNHPPGRHNIGADNLDVPESLFTILHALKKEGYNTGELPESSKALLELIQERGVNLPENGDALAKMAEHVSSLSTAEYNTHFQKISPKLQSEMSQGPLAYLQTIIKEHLDGADPHILKARTTLVLDDLRHLLEGARHPAKHTALEKLELLGQFYTQAFAGDPKAIKQAQSTITEIINLQIEGLQGWGEAPGIIMVNQERMIFPGIQFGNIFIGPQPPRGWELNEELLHGNLTIPPTHQYLGFYFWLHHHFNADALVHLGRHSTFEFLPRRRVGLTDSDYPTIIAGDRPNIYPYIVDGVGEGIQAKRRGAAVLISHLTPPLQTTPLYDQLLQLRQLIESYEAAEGSSDGSSPSRIAEEIRKQLTTLNLRDELVTSMRPELDVRGLTFEQVDNELLVHEVGHYLTQIQEQFMPSGLHVFGRDWTDANLDMMITSMELAEEDRAKTRELLKQSPQFEIEALLAGLNGEYVTPSVGNDPIRSPATLPTGRNLYGLAGDTLPSRLAYTNGLQLARDLTDTEESEALILWASDTVRDEGTMVAMALARLGVRPVWNSRGIINSLERLPLEEGQSRQDIVITTSGLFRDLYGNLLALIDNSVLLAIQGSAQTIRTKHPELGSALDAALEPLGQTSDEGNEPLNQNEVARRWVENCTGLLGSGSTSAQAGVSASYRIFGDSIGNYSAGINRMVARSGSWKERSELAAVYIQRMGHHYGMRKEQGAPVQASFNYALKSVGLTIHGRASNLYGLLDNNDGFDYLGGLNLAVEIVKGEAPMSMVADLSNPKEVSLVDLNLALKKELRGRYLNPEWIKPLMNHGYAGARTMNFGFFENLLGWQVTTPDMIQSWVWDDVKDVYVNDRYDIQLDEFLSSDENAPVQANMLAIMLVAAEKGFWEASPEDLKEVVELFAENINEHGLPGSGHTRYDHPIMDLVDQILEGQQQEDFQQTIEQAAQAYPGEATESEITEIEIKEEAAQENSDWKFVLIFCLVLIGIGGLRGGWKNNSKKK